MNSAGVVILIKYEDSQIANNIDRTTMILFVYTDVQFNWKSVIQELFERVNIEIDPYTKIAWKYVLYFKRLGPLLKRTPARTIGALLKNYFSNISFNFLYLI